MRKSRPTEKAPPAATSEAPAWVDRAWGQALAALWILGIVVYYLRLQLLRFLQLAPR